MLHTKMDNVRRYFSHGYEIYSVRTEMLYVRTYVTLENMMSCVRTNHVNIYTKMCNVQTNVTHE